MTASVFSLAHGFLDFHEIESVVRGEAVVFRGDYSHRHVSRHLVERHPFMLAAHLASVEHLLNAAYRHQRRVSDRRPSVDGYADHRQQHKAENDFAKEHHEDAES